VLFVMLGLLSFPSRLIAVAWEGLLIALVLILVARPLAVWVSALPFQFRRRELTFLSWVGLKGAVPITLATFPLLAGVPKSGQIFNAVFFVVLISAITQGWSLPLVARWLHIGRPADPTPALSVEINALRQVDGEILDYTVKARTHVAGQRLRDLALPDGVVVSLIVRGREVVMPRGTTVLMPGDHAFVAMRMNLEPLINRLFEPDPEPPELPVDLSLSFHAATTVEQLLGFYGLPLPVGGAAPAAAETLSALLEKSTSAEGVSIGALHIEPGADPEHIIVRGLNQMA
jgi:cell volume regulation protein A